MKLMYWTIGLLMAITVILSSCVKHNDIYKEPGRTADLTVPEGFDWASSRNVALAITSPVATEASFFLDEKCTSESQLATFFVPEGQTTFNFDVPDVNNTIYIQYPLAKGGVKTLKQVINQPEAKSGEEGAVHIMFDDRPMWTSDKDSNPIIYIPGGGGYGTLMFEDTWPETGDYDFNDMVVNYKIMPVWKWAESNKINIRVSLIFRALGGIVPYNFAVQIGKTRSWDADHGGFFKAGDLLGITDIQSSDGAVTVEKLEGTVYPAIIVKGLNSLRSEKYYNTITKKDEGVNISFTIRLKADDIYQQFSALTTSWAFDYFLIHETDPKEIHLVGFGPSALYKSYDKDFVSGGENVAGNHYYQNKENFVWGLKVPEEIGWAVEKQDILKVYTKFGYWVKEGGYALENNNPHPLKWYDKRYTNKDLIFQ